MPSENLEREREYRNAGAPVLRELAKLGIHAESIQDLWQFKMVTTEAVPILVKWLPQIGNQGVKSGIVRSLATMGRSREVALALIKEFESASPGMLKWSIGDALTRVADDSVFQELSRVARDKRHGGDREMAVVALGNMTRTPEATDVLIELLDDPETVGHAIIALEKLRPHRAKDDIKRFLNHPKAWVRGRARRTLDKIDSAEKSSGQSSESG